MFNVLMNIKHKVKSFRRRKNDLNLKTYFHYNHSNKIHFNVLRINSEKTIGETNENLLRGKRCM